MSVSASNFGLSGFAFPVVTGGGGSCDYPDPSDVRSGVVYDNGSEIGTLTTLFTGVASVALEHSPADIIRWLLVQHDMGTDPEDQGAWPLYASSEPNLPDDCLTVYDTSGDISDGRHMVDGEVLVNYGIQIRIRSKTHPEGWAKAATIWNELCEGVLAERVDIGASAYFVHALVRIQSPLALGKDGSNSKRSLFTINCMAVINAMVS